ncbi:MAG: TrkA family potassium uptake protein [Bdellovibrionales bacterium]|nr:TrkA family potassium uptake protein [Bdellovibrionales bacterium]
MRIAFVGSSDLSLQTARLLLSGGNEIVIIESDRERIDELSESLDVSFLHGDGSKPSMLRELSPEHTDILFCLTDQDEINVIAALVARTLDFKRVIASIRDPELDSVCNELGLTDIVVPSRTIARYLEDMTHGVDIFELHTVLKGDARFFTFTAGKDSTGNRDALGLPKRAQAICLYRRNEFLLFEENTKIQENDEVVILCHDEVLKELQERFTITNRGDR